MSAGKIALIVLGAALFVIGYAGLFPAEALTLASSMFHDYSIAIGLSPESWHLFGAIGGAAAVSGIWALSSAFRKTA